MVPPSPSLPAPLAATPLQEKGIYNSYSLVVYH